MSCFVVTRLPCLRHHKDLSVSELVVKAAKKDALNCKFDAFDLAIDGHSQQAEVAMQHSRKLARVGELLEQRKRNEGPLHPADHVFLRTNLKLLRAAHPRRARRSCP